MVKILLISQGDPPGGNNKVFGYNSITHIVAPKESFGQKKIN